MTVMGPKGRQYWNLSTGLRFRRFKWQYRVAYKLNNFGEWEQHYSQPFRSRREARTFKAIVPLIGRDIHIERRFVEVDWHPYRDTFSYNEKGSGNGR